MIDIANGSLVKHVSPRIGEVVAVEPTAVHVFFPRARNATQPSSAGQPRSRS